ncbi:hypothetical protein [Robertmurraya sp.]|uniref:hypothetical protein n=1 Tax=Robertmurraya sp. TaxID=2837525 RepID=UPI00370393E1
MSRLFVPISYRSIVQINRLEILIAAGLGRFWLPALVSLCSKKQARYLHHNPAKINILAK